MGVMPLPKFSTLTLAIGRVKLDTDGPAISDFGRLHLTAQERKLLDREEKRKKMAFELINVGELPAREFGRRATEPRISISEGGQFSFNSLVQAHDGFKDAGKLLVRYDSASRKIGFMALKAEQKVKGIADNAYLPLKWGVDKETKERNGLASASGAGILTKIGYDYKPGNVSIEASFDDKNKMFVITLPESMKSPTKVVKPKEEKEKTKAAAVGSTAEVEEATEEELVEIQ